MKDNQIESIEFFEHNRSWQLAYQQEKSIIAKTLNKDIVEIQHIGSTAIPGLAAKPIIDILIAVERFTPDDKYSCQLHLIGYHHQPEASSTDRLFFWKGTPRTHHIHIVEYGKGIYWRHILFRDYLRNHREIALQYEALKRKMALKFCSDKVAYAESKTQFIDSVVELAKQINSDRSLANNHHN